MQVRRRVARSFGWEISNATLEGFEPVGQGADKVVCQDTANVLSGVIDAACNDRTMEVLLEDSRGGGQHERLRACVELSQSPGSHGCSSRERR